jgi:hypothetical protein
MQALALCEINDESDKTVYYPIVARRLATSLQGSTARQIKSDVWRRRTVDACSSEGLQTVNGPAMARHARSGVSYRRARATGWEARMQTKLSASSPNSIGWLEGVPLDGVPPGRVVMPRPDMDRPLAGAVVPAGSPGFLGAPN